MVPVLAAYAPEPKRLALRLRSALNQSVERGPLVAVYLEVFARKVDDDVLLGFLLHVYVRAHLALKNVITALGFLGAGLILPFHVSDVAARKSLTLTTDGTGFLSLPENAFLPSIERLLNPGLHHVRREVRVLLRHLHVAVAEDRPNDGERHAALHHPRGAGVPQVVEADALGKFGEANVFLKQGLSAETT